MNIDQAFEKFVEGCNVLMSGYFEREYPTLPVPEIGYTTGKRYWRVFKEAHGSRSAYCFVDRDTGDVLKPAGWKKPAKGVRSSIFDDDAGLSGVTVYGAVNFR